VPVALLPFPLFAVFVAEPDRRLASRKTPAAPFHLKRWYMPADLQRLLGDIPADAIRMRCERCRKTEWIRASFERPTAAERQTIKLRRLAGIKMVRKVIWIDDQ
jgi:hypothetical protein